MYYNQNVVIHDKLINEQRQKPVVEICQKVVDRQFLFLHVIKSIQFSEGDKLTVVSDTGQPEGWIKCALEGLVPKDYVETLGLWEYDTYGRWENNE